MEVGEKGRIDTIKEDGNGIGRLKGKKEGKRSRLNWREGLKDSHRQIGRRGGKVRYAC